jgi:PAS domain S-box-containing protein
LYASTPLTEEILASAVKAARVGGDSLVAALEQLDAPIYVTDRAGVVTYFNRACIGFTGRTPTVGKDRWCVTWKLYTDTGEFLPHDQCPMAVAILEERVVRGLTAVAERPDGTRVSFLPFPTPLRDAEGQLVGAVNILIDITELRQIPELRSQAARARWLASAQTDFLTISRLHAMAEELEGAAASLAASSLYVSAT